MNIKINNYEDMNNIFIKSNSNEWVFLKDKEYFIVSKKSDNNYCLSLIKNNWETFETISNDIKNIKDIFEISEQNNNLIYCSDLNKNNPPYEIEEIRFSEFFSKLSINELIDIKRYLNDADLNSCVSYWVYTKTEEDFQKIQKEYKKTSGCKQLETNKLLNCFKFINSPVVEKLLQISNKNNIELKFVSVFNLGDCKYKKEILNLYKKWSNSKLIIENIVFGDSYFMPEECIVDFDTIISLIDDEIKTRS